MDLTPIEYKDGIFLKREDLFNIEGCCGSKTRVIFEIMNNAIKDGHKIFVSAGSRDSVQCEIISKLSDILNVKSYLFMPQGQDTPALKKIYKSNNTELIRTKVGYTSVLKSWSSKFAKENNYFYIPFALETEESIIINKDQVKNIPNDIERIVVPIGSGMNFISILTGLNEIQYKGEVLGIQIGLDPQKNIDLFLKNNNIKYNIIKTDLPYNKKEKNNLIGDVYLNQTYEAKCKNFLKPNDLFWIVGNDIIV